MSGILVVRPSSLGDIVHALASCRTSGSTAREPAIDWVAEEMFAARARSIETCGP